jgi:protein-L-isoaspartate(D-aspartate) O-methyltransferase
MSAAIDLTQERHQMVQEQLVRRGIRDERVLDAMRKVPREQFIDRNLVDQAYVDGPLPIGGGQTISQPYVVARMCELARVRSEDVVLEVGAGCGYQMAVLAQLARRVIGIEIREDLAERARRTLAELGIANADVRRGDGGYGAPDAAPFDAILIAAATERPPPPLLEQLATGGRLLLPLGSPSMQELVRMVKRSDGFATQSFGAVRFVSFVGDYGERSW